MCRSRVSTRTTRSIAPQNEKYAAILAEIERANARLQPVLVGTASIEKSEMLAEYLKKHGYKQIDFGNPKSRCRSFTRRRATTSRQSCSRC